MPSGALCEKPKDASSTRKQLSSGPLALALICATGTLVGQPSLVEERTRPSDARAANFAKFWVLKCDPSARAGHTVLRTTT